MMIQFLALVRKDLKLFFTDRRALVAGLLVPIICGSFFGYLFGGQKGNTETGKVPVLVIDQDESEISREVVAQLASNSSLGINPSTPDAAREVVGKGKATAAIIIPKNFGREAGRALFEGGAKPAIDLLYDPSHALELGMVKGILDGAVMQTVSKEMFAGKSGRELVTESLARLEKSDLPSEDRTTLRDLLNGVRNWNEQQERDGAAGHGGFSIGLTMPYATQERAITSSQNSEYNGYAHSFGGMGVQFVLFMGLDAGITLLMLRQSGLWQRLRAAPLSRAMLLGSRAVSAALIASFILLVIFGFARVVFGVHIQGSIAGFLGVCAAFSLMTAAFGLMVAALGDTVEATRGYSILATLILVMLGGAWVPTFVFPVWLQKLTVINPTRWAIDGLDAMTWRGLGFSAALGPIEVLLVFTLLFGTLAVMRFRWRIED
jgi:ABC-2 type transport system permease protein